MSNTIPKQSFVDKIAAGLRETEVANRSDVIKSNVSNSTTNFKQVIVNDHLVNQKLFDKVAAGLRDINSTVDTSKADEEHETYLNLSTKTIQSVKDTSKVGGVNEPIENQVKPVLWLESDSSVSASTIVLAAKGHDWIPVEEILEARDGMTMTMLTQYFEVKVKVAKEI